MGQGPCLCHSLPPAVPRPPQGGKINTLQVHCKHSINRVEAAAPPSTPDRPVSAVRRKYSLHGPCHKKASGSGIRFLKLFHPHILFFNPLHPFLLYQPYLPYILSDPLLFIPAASFPFIFYISLHLFLLCQPYLPYILSDPLLLIPAASFPFIFHRALSFISFRFLHPGTESVIFEQLVSLAKPNICPVCTYFFQIVPIYKLSFSQKINFFDSIYCIILVIKSYSRGERPAQESVPPERYIVAGRQLFPAVVLQLFWKGDGNRWLMQLFGERQNRKESFGNLLKNTKISPEQ